MDAPDGTTADRGRRPRLGGAAHPDRGVRVTPIHRPRPTGTALPRRQLHPCLGIDVGENGQRTIDRRRPRLTWRKLRASRGESSGSSQAQSLLQSLSSCSCSTGAVVDRPAVEGAATDPAIHLASTGGTNLVMPSGVISRHVGRAAMRRGQAPGRGELSGCKEGRRRHGCEPGRHASGDRVGPRRCGWPVSVCRCRDCPEPRCRSRTRRARPWPRVVTI